MSKLRYTSLALLLLATGVHANPVVIDDASLMDSFNSGVSAYAELGPKAEDLIKELKAAPRSVTLSLPEPEAATGTDQSVFLIGSVYNCGKCHKWHTSPSASAWVLSADGLMVTNYHVFKKANGAAMGICSMDGKTHRIIGIVAADPQNDIAIFRVDAKDLSALKVGAPLPIGGNVEVVSHPDGEFFTHTFGRVSRYHMAREGQGKKGFCRMSITADYAKGSSGGPVLDDKGNVVGMVSSTQSIYYNSNKGQPPAGPLQMVVKDCIPVAAISAMISAAEAPGN